MVRDEEARRQTVTRDVNEWIERASESMELGSGIHVFRCECGDEHCDRAIELTRAEYEHVREHPVRFAIVRNHENPECDVVVAEYERYAVIEKLVGGASTQARRSSRR